METIKHIRIDEISIHCRVDLSFIHALHELGHIHLISEEEVHFITERELKALERYIYFHTELQINLEGIDTIAHLLQNIEGLQTELSLAKNKLAFYLSGK